MGSGKAIDTNHFRVICANILGSPYGTSSPISINPETGERYVTFDNFLTFSCRYAKKFPQITPRDQALVHKLLIESLGIDKVEAIVGSSLGMHRCVLFSH